MLPGRADELALIADAIARGEPSGFVILGEAGIGKSTLLRAVADQARTAGASVLTMRWSEDPGAPPLWPWSSLVRSTASVVGARVLGEVHPLVRRLVDDVAIGAGLDVPEAPADEIAGRFAMGDGIGRLVGRAAPTVVLLEDLHHGVAASLALLGPFAEAAIGLGAIVVATSRDAPPAQPLLAGAARRVVLESLDKDEAATLVRAVAPRLDDVAVDTVVLRGGGNPFFLSELARLAESGATESTTEGVRSVVLQRVGHLGNGARDVLAIAALLGPEPSLPLLAQVHGDDGLVAAVVDDAERAQLVHAFDDAFSWEHDLVRDALVDSLGLVERRRLHAAIAETLRTNPSTSAYELAHHALASGVVSSDVLTTGREAARHALGTGALEDAIAWADRSLVVARRVDASAVAELESIAGRAHVGLGDHGRGRERLVRAAETAIAHGDGANAAAALLGIGAERLRGNDTLLPPRELVDEALALLGPDDAALRCRLIGRRADLAETPEAMHDERYEALRIARANGDADLLITALGRVLVDERAESLDAREAMMNEAWALSRAAGPERQFEAAAFRSLVLFERGDVDEAMALCPSINAMVLRLGLPQALNFETAEILGHFLQGRFELVDDRMAALVATAKGFAGDYMTTQAVHSGVAAMLQGRFGEIVGMADMFLASTAGSPFAVRVHALVALGLALAGQRERAEESVREVIRFGLDNLEVFGFGQPDYFRQLVAEAACELRMRDEAALIEPYLEPFANRVPIGGMAPAVSFGAADHQLAWLAALRGDRDAARGRIDRAVALHRRMGATPFLARSLALSARLAQDAGEAVLATEHAREAATLAARQQMPREAEAAAAILASYGAAPVRGASVGGAPAAIVFTDIESSTASAAALGDAAWLERLRSHDSAVRRLVAKHSGREIKHLGDGFMLTFPTATAAIEFGLALQAEFTDALVRVRAGIHVGPVVEEDGDVFGTTVNVAARVSAAASGGETVISAAVLALVPTAPVGAPREVALKGVEGMTALYPLTHAP